MTPSEASKDRSTRKAPEGENLWVEAFHGSDQEWDRLLGSFQGSTFCHLGAWRAVFHHALGHESHYRVALDREGAVKGLLPLVRVRSRLFGDYLVSMPFPVLRASNVLITFPFPVL